MVYGSIATGYVAGGFTETCGSVFTCQPYNDEENINVEFGLKLTEWMEDSELMVTEYDSLQRDSVKVRLVGDTQQEKHLLMKVQQQQDLKLKYLMLQSSFRWFPWIIGS